MRSFLSWAAALALLVSVVPAFVSVVCGTPEPCCCAMLERGCADAAPQVDSRECCEVRPAPAGPAVPDVEILKPRTVAAPAAAPTSLDQIAPLPVAIATVDPGVPNLRPVHLFKLHVSFLI